MTSMRMSLSLEQTKEYRIRILFLLCRDKTPITAELMVRKALSHGVDRIGKNKIIPRESRLQEGKKDGRGANQQRGIISGV